MTEDRKNILTRVFTDILEQMAFMFGDKASPDDFRETAEPMLQAQMTYRGNLCGSLSLAVPEAMCPELAANLLGTEPEEAGERHIYIDALKELLNVTCGNVLTAMAGEEPVFDLTVPEVTELSDAMRDTMLNDETTVYLLVDEYPAALRLTVEESA